MNKLIAILLIVLFANTSISTTKLSNNDEWMLEAMDAEIMRISDSLAGIAVVTTKEVVVLDSVVGKLEDNGKDAFYEFAKREKELIAEIRRLKGYE